MPGFGEQLIAEGDVDVAEDEQALIEEFRRQLDQGMWAAVPDDRRPSGRREATMVRAFDEIPRDTERVIFFPRAAGGAQPAPGHDRRALGHRDRRPRAAVGDLDAVARAAPRRAPARQARAPRERRAPRTTRAASAAPSSAPASCCKSCVNEEEWAMYRDLGFLRVWGGQSDPDGPSELRGVDYAYLIYPHKPIVAYLPQTGRLLNEYCVEFPDETRPYGSPRLPDSDDVLAKWMALKRRRAPDHRRGEPAPARPPGRPAPDRARPLAPRPLGARAPRPRAARRQRRQRQAEPADG